MDKAKLFHGTNSYSWGLIQQANSLQARVYLQSFTHSIEEEYELVSSSIWKQLEQKPFSRHEDPYVYLTHDRSIARAYADRGSAFLLDVLREAYQLLHPGLVWNGESRGEAFKFWNEWQKKHEIDPVILTFAIPFDNLPIPKDSLTHNPRYWYERVSQGHEKGELSFKFSHSLSLEYLVGAKKAGILF